MGSVRRRARRRPHALCYTTLGAGAPARHARHRPRRRARSRQRVACLFVGLFVCLVGWLACGRSPAGFDSCSVRKLGTDRGCWPSAAGTAHPIGTTTRGTEEREREALPRSTVSHAHCEGSTNAGGTRPTGDEAMTEGSRSYDPATVHPLIPPGAVLTRVRRASYVPARPRVICRVGGSGGTRFVQWGVVRLRRWRPRSSYREQAGRS